MPRARSFPIRLDRRAWPILLAFGVRPGTAWLQLQPDRIVARFGFSRAEIPLTNVERWDITGPYRWWRSIGIRASLGEPEITYGGSSHGGVCLHLRTPVRIAGVSVRRFYVTVDDLLGLGLALTARGIPGRDERKSGPGPTPTADRLMPADHRPIVPEPPAPPRLHCVSGRTMPG